METRRTISPAIIAAGEPKPLSPAQIVGILDDVDKLADLLARLREAGRCKVPKDADDYGPPSFFRDLIYGPAMALGTADLFFLSPDWPDRFAAWGRIDPNVRILAGPSPGVVMTTLTGPDALVVVDGRIPSGTAISLTTKELKLTPFGRKLVVLAPNTHLMIEGVRDGSIRGEGDRGRRNPAADEGDGPPALADQGPV